MQEVGAVSQAVSEGEQARNGRQLSEGQLRRSGHGKALSRSKIQITSVEKAIYFPDIAI